MTTESDARTGLSNTATRPAVTKRDMIAAEIKRLINTGELPRGQRLQQEELAVRFETSITPVREALRQLATEGILVAQPNRGVRVADADLDQVKLVYLQRRLIEPYAMQRATRRFSPLDLDLAEGLVNDMERAVGDSDRVRLNELNYEFHFLFYERTGIAGISEYIEMLWSQYPWDVLQVLPERMNETNAEHRAQLTAVRAGDIEAVREVTEKHLSNSFLRLAEHLSGSPVPDPFDIDND
ncbi:GntR family transcriptional regulator [Nocardia sp. NPDC050630]|uniref:GntR family transcriptional regulator n=1 Tax=Nocardia sp. NPDC050630 TaxID=3364321 RepID=UPI0037B68AB4